MAELRRARWAVAATFFTNGFAIANLVPRYPEIKDALELTNTGFGTAIAFLPVGSIIAGLAAGHLVARFTSARVATLGMVLLSLASIGVLMVGYAPVPWIALAGFALMGIGCSAVYPLAVSAAAQR